MKKSLTCGFTLIELIVSITILSVVLMSVFTIYSNLIAINKRLQIVRIVQENTRSITEEIANDIREKGIDMSYYDGTTSEKTLNYTGSGNAVLAIKGVNRTLYYAMKKNPIGGVFVGCNDADFRDPKTHCFIGKEEGPVGSITTTSLSDDRVRINGSHFFISGDRGAVQILQAKSAKATIILSLAIENSAGVSSDIAKNTQMHIETTVSEKVYQKN